MTDYKKEEHLAYIDALRGVAILMVILVHVSQQVSGLSRFVKPLCSFGQTGVQLFFVLSAYTLCLSFKHRQNERQRIKKFYVRRFFRIAPLYYLGILLYFLCAVFAAYQHTGTLSWPQQYSFLNILANVLFVHSFYPPANAGIVPGGWSIGTEMAFYAIFPLLYQYFDSRKKDLRLYLIPIICLALSWIALRVLAYYTGLGLGNNSFLYYSIINQLPVFLLGICVFFCNPQLSRFWAAALLFITLFAAIALFTFKFEFALVPFAGGVAFIFLFKLFKVNRYLSFSILISIGKVSYSIYLFHFLVVAFSITWLAGYLQGLLSPDATLAVCFLAAVALSYLVALASAKLIEARGIKTGNNLIKNHMH